MTENYYEYEELRDATENFSESRLIGKGSHGIVYKATLKNDVVVAVKLGDDSKLEIEARVLHALPPSPYVVELLGTSRDSGRLALVMEHLPNGTLHDTLHAPPEAAPPPSWARRAGIAIRLAKALRCLHALTPPVVHRDVKPANVLFDAGGRAKLADFGLASQLGSDSPSRPAGTMGYLDPGYNAPGDLSTKSDVYSFGVVLLELMSCQKAIDVTRSPSHIVAWAVQLMNDGRTLEICDKRTHVPFYMQDTVNHILGIAIRCASPEEENRPSMDEIVDELENCIMIEHTKFPIWIMSILRSLTLVSRKRVVHAGKVLVREILTETTSLE